MSTITTNPTNGVSYGVIHVLTATDVADAVITFDFQNSISLVASLVHTDSTGAVLNDILNATLDVITYPASGKVTVTKGLGSWTAGDIFHIICQRARTV